MDDAPFGNRESGCRVSGVRCRVTSRKLDEALETTREQIKGCRLALQGVGSGAFALGKSSFVHATAGSFAICPDEARGLQAKLSRERQPTLDTRLSTPDTSAMKPLLLALLPILALLSPTLRADDAKPAAAVEKKVTPDEAQKLIQQKKDLVILDVRTPEEFAAGHIAGAKNLDFHGDDFLQKLKSLDKSKDYLVHCMAGGRSAQAVKKMEQEHFQTIYHMNGGLSAWKEAGKPVEKGK